MPYTYGFQNQCGVVYKTGNLVFTPDGNSLLSAVGNRVSVFDLVAHTSFTLDFETRSDIGRMAISPDGRILLVVDVGEFRDLVLVLRGWRGRLILPFPLADGYAVAANFHRRIILHRFNFKEKVRDISFSPDGKFFAVAIGNKMQVWKTPGMEREFSAFVLHRTYTGHHAAVNSVSWSKNSLYLVTGSKDMSCKVFSLHPIPGYIPVTLTGHRDEVVSATFAEEDVIYSVSADGGTFIWAWKPRPEIAEATIERIAKKQRRAERLMLKGTSGEALGDEGEDDDSQDDSEEEGASNGVNRAKGSAQAVSGSKRKRPTSNGDEEDDAEEDEEEQVHDEEEEELSEEQKKAMQFEDERSKRGISSKGTVGALTAREGGRGKSVKSATDFLATRRPHVVPAPFADATKTAAAMQPKAGAASKAAEDGEGCVEQELNEDEAALAEAADGDKREAARIGVRLSVTHGEWTLSAKHLLRTNRTKVVTATVHAASGLLVLGLSSGVFSLFTMPDGQQVHSLSVSSHQIHASAINASGDWLAFGSSTLGQLLVWEWKTETCECSKR
jgi:WD domain, G-beta repeat